MRIEQLRAKPRKSRQPGHLLCEAAQMIWDHDCGCLPVTAGYGCQRVVGLTQGSQCFPLAMIDSP